MVASDAQRAVLYYTAPLTQPRVKHGEHVGFEDASLRDTLVDNRVACQVSMENARKHSFALSPHGFELRKWPTSVANFADSAAVLQQYVPEMETLVADAMRANGFSGVHAVVLWDICLRDSTLTNELQTATAKPGCELDLLAPVSLVHADFYDADSLTRRLRERWTTSTDTLSSYMRADFESKGLSRCDMERWCGNAATRGRVLSVNVWRCIDIEQPVRRCPLAVCDPASLNVAEEQVPFVIRCPDVELTEAHFLSPERGRGAEGAESAAVEGSQHRWYSFPEMVHDECLLFLSGDTEGSVTAVPHTSFEDPRTQPHDPPRRSIEARVFVLFSPESERE